MKVSWNIILFSLAMSASIGMLSGCGGGGFKSKVYTPTEIAAYRAKKGDDVKAGGPETAAPIEEQVIAAPQETPAPQAETGDPAATGEGSTSKVYLEPDTETRTLITENLKYLTMKNAGAIPYMNGVDLAASVVGDGAKVAVKAMISLESVPMTLTASEVTVKFDDLAEVTPVAFTLQTVTKDPAGSKSVEANDRVRLKVLCGTPACGEIHVVFFFQDGAQYTPAIFKMVSRDGAKFEQDGNSLNNEPSFISVADSIAALAAAEAELSAKQEAAKDDSGEVVEPVAPVAGTTRGIVVPKQRLSEKYPNGVPLTNANIDINAQVAAAPNVPATTLQSAIEAEAKKRAAAQAHGANDAKAAIEAAAKAEREKKAAAAGGRPWGNGAR